MVGPGVTTNGSCVSWIGKPHGPTLLCETLWDEGCVYYARTTQPQLIMHLETNSNVYGCTVNPYNRKLTPGGSSGGESALLGMRGSILVSVNSLSLRFLVFFFLGVGAISRAFSLTSFLTLFYDRELTAAGHWRRYWRQRPLSSSACWCLRVQVRKPLLSVM